MADHQRAATEPVPVDTGERWLLGPTVRLLDLAPQCLLSPEERAQRETCKYWRDGPDADSCAAANEELFDHLVGASVRGLIQATPLSEAPQSTALRLFARPAR